MKKQRRTSAPGRSGRHSPSGGEIRLIGGDWRGRKLPVLNADGLRPTSDRVRETLFNWLQFDLPGKRVLDAFAGTGALGLEALSRGAAHTTLVEAAPVSARQLRTNLERLAPAAERFSVIEQDVLRWLKSGPDTPAQRFDGVFLDPPFGQALMAPVVAALVAGDWLNDQAWLYLEQEKQTDWPPLPSGWVFVKQKTTAQVRFGLVKKEA